MERLARFQFSAFQLFAFPQDTFPRFGTPLPDCGTAPGGNVGTRAACLSDNPRGTAAAKPAGVCRCHFLSPESKSAKT